MHVGAGRRYVCRGRIERGRARPHEASLQSGLLGVVGPRRRRRRRKRGVDLFDVCATRGNAHRFQHFARAALRTPLRRPEQMRGTQRLTVPSGESLARLVAQQRHRPQRCPSPGSLAARPLSWKPREGPRAACRCPAARPADPVARPPPPGKWTAAGSCCTCGCAARRRGARRKELARFGPAGILQKRRRDFSQTAAKPPPCRLTPHHDSRLVRQPMQGRSAATGAFESPLRRRFFRCELEYANHAQPAF